MPKITPYWEGYVTRENMDDVAQAILTILDGKTFAVAIVNGSTGQMPAVRSSMQLVGDKIRIARGPAVTWNCYILLYTAGGTTRAEEAMYIRDDDGSSAKNPFVRIFWDTIQIKHNRSDGLEYVVLAVH